MLERLKATERHPEGLFFPDTYLFGKGSSDLAVLRRAYRAMTRHLKEEWEARDTTTPYKTPYEALTMASIIEKETGQAGERDMIGGVLVNRLRIGMRLQVDPTIIYGLGADLRRQPEAQPPHRGRPLQHLHARRPAADADRHAGPRFAALGDAARQRPTPCTTCRRTTAPASSRARWKSTTARSTKYQLRGGR